MRCKNCGTENDDSRYICEICGSPLYDEDDMKDAAAYDTQTITPQQGSNKNNTPDSRGGNTDKNTKKSVIIIIVLCLVLAAIIAGIAIAASSKNKDVTTASSVTSSSTINDTTDDTTTRRTTTTTEKTTKETTTKKQTTTEKTTVSLANFNVYIDIDGYGTVSGDGVYQQNTKATLTAVPDQGYVFDAWYENGAIVGTSTKYTFTVRNDTTIKAQFSKIEGAEQ